MKTLLRTLPLYHHLKQTYHWSKRTKRKIRNRLTPTGFIFLYHRITDVHKDPHILSVSPDHFREQLSYLKKHFFIQSLAEMVYDIKNKTLRRNALAITFDDGYADNLINALPILEEFDVPATIFVTSGAVGSNQPFSWEKDTPAVDRGCALTHDELITFAQHPLIQIGAHTLTHPNLAKVTHVVQEQEIIESKRQLETMLGKPIHSFAYPFGSKDSFTDDTIALVQQAGFAYACANIHERVTRNSSPFALPRYVIRDWDINELAYRLQSFL